MHVLTVKHAAVEARLHYPRNLQLGFVLALLLVILPLLLVKRIGPVAVKPKAPVIELTTVDVPITRQLTRPPAPLRPTIPVQDPEIPLELDLPAGALEMQSWNREALPRAPSLESAVLDFYSVQQPPRLLGGPLELAKIIQRKKLYPEMALRAGIPGAVLLEFTVTGEGEVVDAEVIQARPAGIGFERAALAALALARFQPGMQRDRAVAVRMTLPIEFALE